MQKLFIAVRVFCVVLVDVNLAKTESPAFYQWETKDGFSSLAVFDGFDSEQKNVSVLVQKLISVDRLTEKSLNLAIALEAKKNAPVRVKKRSLGAKKDLLLAVLNGQEWEGGEKSQFVLSPEAINGIPTWIDKKTVVGVMMMGDESDLTGLAVVMPVKRLLDKADGKSNTKQFQSICHTVGSFVSMSLGAEVKPWIETNMIQAFEKQNGVEEVIRMHHLALAGKLDGNVVFSIVGVD